MTAAVLCFGVVAVASAEPVASSLTCSGRVVSVDVPRFRKVPLAFQASTVLAGAMSAGDFDGSGSEELLIFSPEHQQLQLGVFDQTGGTLTLQAPTTLPPACRIAGGVVADVDGRGRAEFIGYQTGSTQLLRVSIGSSAPVSCVPWISLWPGRSLVQLVTARRFHRGADALLGVASDQTRLLWRQHRDVVEFGAPLWAPWDQRTVAGAVSLSGDDSVFGVIACRRTFGACSLQHAGRTEQLPNWFNFPESNITYLPPLFGDIDGDDHIDAVSYESAIGGWYAAFGDQTTALEHVVHGLPPHAPPGMLPVLIDANHDGMSDVLMFSQSPEPVQLYLSEAGRPLAGVELRNGQSDAVLATTDARGGYSFALPVGSTVRLQREGFEFTPASFAVSASCPTVRSAPTSPPSGRAVRRVGDDPGPYVCTGYNPGSVNKWGEPVGACPEGYAVVATDDVAGYWPTNAAVPVSGVCCRMPERDMVTSEVITADIECPSGTVVIGGQQNLYCKECTKSLRCAKVNSARYLLGPEEGGRYWGIGRNMRWMSIRTDKRDVPLALRLALGRLSDRTWDADGCIGQHYGSVLTKKAQSCEGERYRQFLYAGLPGDPPAGTPVVYFPDCADISDTFDGSAGCVRRGVIQNPKVDP